VGLKNASLVVEAEKEHRLRGKKHERLARLYVHSGVSWSLAPGVAESNLALVSSVLFK